MPEHPNLEPSIFQLMLVPHQAEHFWPLLNAAKDRTGISGIVCTVNRCLDLANGSLVLELQAACLDPVATRKEQQIIAESRKESE
jgi:hypothetical protein